MANRNRTYDLRRVSGQSSYSVQDVARTLGVHPNTVRTWFRLGLPKIEERRPWLVHGSALIRFVADRQKARKRPCSADEFYCVRCRVPRVPWERVVDVVIVNEKKLILSGLCPVCECRINRAGSVARADDYRSGFTSRRYGMTA